MSHGGGAKKGGGKEVVRTDMSLVIEIVVSLLKKAPREEGLRGATLCANPTLQEALAQVGLNLCASTEAGTFGKHFYLRRDNSFTNLPVYFLVPAPTAPVSEKQSKREKEMYIGFLQAKLSEKGKPISNAALRADKLFEGLNGTLMDLVEGNTRGICWYRDEKPGHQPYFYLDGQFVPPQVQPAKTVKVCKHYLFGKCKFGPKCRNSHPVSSSASGGGGGCDSEPDDASDSHSEPEKARDRDYEPDSPRRILVCHQTGFFLGGFLVACLAVQCAAFKPPSEGSVQELEEEDFEKMPPLALRKSGVKDA